MSQKVRLVTSIFLIVFTAACNDSANKSNTGNVLSAFSADSLGRHIAVLSGDDYMGRKPFSEGESKTISYLQEQFRVAGLEPGNGTSYLQEVPMVNITTTAAPTMHVHSAIVDFNLQGRDDYVIWTDKTDSVVSFNNDEMVFAGYGVVAPEYNWNDYAGLDVKGKIVLILVNDPGFNAGDSSLFKGKTMTYYGRWTYKFEEAARQGAKGCLIVHNTIAAAYPFKVVQNNWNTSKLHLDERGKNKKYSDIIGWISSEAAHKLLAAAGMDSSLFVKADKLGFKGSLLNIKLSTSMQVKATYDKSQNVIGKITGSKYPDETIIYTAHWDHLGIGAPDENGDSIYNGALDNASATAGLLELARGFKKSGRIPERTIIFLSVTAEEQGLWGSAFYAQNPLYPINRTVANINMDGLNWFGKTKDVIVIGEGQSDLEDYLKEEAAKVNRYISFDTHPEAGSYYRSDHFNFAKVGVPALYIKVGTEAIGKEKGFGQKMIDDYVKNNYHRPSDEYNAATWNLDGAIEDLQLLFNIGHRLAFNHQWPEWKTGSEFKAIREAKK
ncbi:MAG: M28 family peptidase [Ferruginibacter sp.]|nr:M28 family peptidase [Ferruginibacter sp.]